MAANPRLLTNKHAAQSLGNAIDRLTNEEPKIKLPALTRAEIEALPDGQYILIDDVIDTFTRWTCGQSGRRRWFVNDEGVITSREIARLGGIGARGEGFRTLLSTARTEAAALREKLAETRAVLRDARTRTANHKADGVPGNEPYCECDLCLFIMDNVDTIERLAANAQPCGTCGGAREVPSGFTLGHERLANDCPDCAEGEA